MTNNTEARAREVARAACTEGQFWPGEEGVAIIAAAIVRVGNERAAQEREANAAVVEALRPFVDLGPQRGAWGVISKALDDLAPLMVTVTKAQMKAAFVVVTQADAARGQS